MTSSLENWKNEWLDRLFFQSCWKYQEFAVRGLPLLVLYHPSEADPPREGGGSARAKIACQALAGWRWQWGEACILRTLPVVGKNSIRSENA